MPNGNELKSPAADALRAAGYRPCPRVWLTEEQMELVNYMARQNEEEVDAIRYRLSPSRMMRRFVEKVAKGPRSDESLGDWCMKIIEKAGLIIGASNQTEGDE